MFVRSQPLFRRLSVKHLKRAMEMGRVVSGDRGWGHTWPRLQCLFRGTLISRS